jgi:diadenosine tetraphosphate (Ap4A) HIT family hydrolase
MQPDAASPLPSPFSAIPEAEWACANELAFTIFDSFPMPHVHVHVIPRYAGDMPDPRGGVRFV